MYERFTDRARKVIQLANQEAQRLDHPSVDTGHVLLGLVKEGSGVAANVLKNLDVDLRKIRLEVEKLVPPGPGIVEPGKLPMTPRAKRVLEYTVGEADALGHRGVGTEHLLLGLLREDEGIARQVLNTLGVSADTVRKETLHILGVPEEATPPARYEVHPDDKGQWILYLIQQQPVVVGWFPRKEDAEFALRAFTMWEMLVLHFGNEELNL